METGVAVRVPAADIDTFLHGEKDYIGITAVFEYRTLYSQWTALLEQISESINVKIAEL